jgi:hypothetical protein
MYKHLDKKDKTFYDLTSIDQPEWRAGIENEIERLSDIVTALLYKRNPQ